MFDGLLQEFKTAGFNSEKSPVLGAVDTEFVYEARRTLLPMTTARFASWGNRSSSVKSVVDFTGARS